MCSQLFTSTVAGGPEKASSAQVDLPGTRGSEATPIVHLCLVNQESLLAAQARQTWGPGEGEAADRRPGSALARALLRGMLAEMTGTPSEHWRIVPAASGAPMAVGRGGGTAPAVSLSHSGSWVACAASFAGDLGIDIEMRKDHRDMRGIAERAFGPGEQSAAKRDGVDRFYAVWTLREAIAKATGEGLRMAVDAVDRVADGPYEASLWARFDESDWWLMHARPSAELSLAVALRPRASGGTQPAIRLQWWPAGESSDRR